MMTEVTTVETIELDFDNDRYVQAEVEIGWTWVDNGIGSYEFWGTPGIHTSYELEFDSFFIDSFELSDDDGDVTEFINNDKSKKEHPVLWEKVQDIVQSYIENMDPPDATMDDDDYEEL